MSKTFVTSVFQRAPQDRHVLAPGVHQNLHGRVCEHAREGREVEITLERVKHLGAHPVLGIWIRHGHLHQTQQRLIAALGDELRVDGNPPTR